METLKVEQCDRDAAADLYLALDGDLPTHEITEEADRHRRGDRDHTAPVQAFARHRIAERERCAGTDTCEMPEVAAMRYIEELRSDFGSVTILPDNDEANHRSEQVGIDCCGEWTNWQDQRFMGESVLQCLAVAVGVKAKSQAIREQSNGA